MYIHIKWKNTYIYFFFYKRTIEQKNEIAETERCENAIKTKGKN